MNQITDLKSFSDKVRLQASRENADLLNQLSSGDLLELDRFQLIWNNKLVQEAEFDELKVNVKDEKRSTKHREIGNKLYEENGIAAAVKEYNKAILIAPYPPEDPTERDSNHFLQLALAYGNRSAMLYSLGRYHFSLLDAMRAVTLNYPEHMKQKQFERQGHCYMAMHEYDEALQSYLKGRKLCSDKKKAKELESRIAEAKRGTQKKNNENKSTVNDDFYPVAWRKVPSISGKPNPGIQAASTALSLVESTGSKSKEFIATRDIDPGEVLLVESALGYCLAENRSQKNCGHCLRYACYPIPCCQCTQVVYCVEQCQLEAWDAYHKYECAALSAIREHAGSPHLALAVNTVVTASTTFIREFTKVEKKNKDEEKQNFIEQFEKDGIHETFLVGSNSQCLKPDLFSPGKQIEYGVNASIALKALLLRTTLLDQLSNTPIVQVLDKVHANENQFSGSMYSLKTSFSDVKLEPSSKSSTLIQEKIDKIGWKLCSYVGSAIMHQEHTIQLNYRLITESHQKGELTKEEPIAIGSFRYARYVPHSCCPNTIATSYGKTLAITATETIRKGETVTAPFSPYLVYYDVPLKHRSEALKSFLGTECKCRACVEQWPNGEEFTSKRQKGETAAYFICPHCSNPIPERFLGADNREVTECNKCSMSVTSAVYVFNMAASIWSVGQEKVFMEKSRSGTATAADAAELLKRTCTFRSVVVEKYYAHRSDIFYALWRVMHICMQRMGNFCNVQKQFGRLGE